MPNMILKSVYKNDDMKYLLSLLLIIICPCFLSIIRAQHTIPPGDRVWYVSDFGARGDGKTLNTTFIQQTIDACSAAGGGKVKVTAGHYLSGTLFLKDGVELYVDVNAKLIGSKNKQDYKDVQGLAVNGKPRYGDFGTFLIYAENVKNISIAGRGIIDGNGESFWESEMLTQGVRKPKKWRPVGLVGFVNCQFINIRDASFINSPCFTIWPLGCDDIKIDGITIRNPIVGPNTDGIDIDCCRRVTISNCNISGGDDAIAIKSDSGKLGEERPCENIVVTNCILSSPPACAVRIGYEGDSPIRNCVFSNLAMYNSNHGIDMISILPDRGYSFTVFEGTRLENIQFDNIVMQKVTQPVFLWLGNEKKGVKPALSMQNIRISNVIASDAGGSYIGGISEQNIENIFLSDIYVSLTNEIPKGTAFYTHVWNSKNPYAFYFHNVKGLGIDNLKIDLSSAKGIWEYAVYFKNSKEVVLNKLSTKNSNSTDLKAQIGADSSSLQIFNHIPENNIKPILSDKSSVIVYDNKLIEMDK